MVTHAVERIPVIRAREQLDEVLTLQLGSGMMKASDQQERIAQIRKRAEIAEVDTRELKRTKPLEKSFIRKTLEWLGRSPKMKRGITNGRSVE